MTGANALLHELEQAAGSDAVLATETERVAYAADESSAAPALPDVVVRPADAAAVARVLAVAHARRVPVVPVGGRTGLAGGSVPVRGGIALSLERLDRIGPVDRDNFTVSAGGRARGAGGGGAPPPAGG